MSDEDDHHPEAFCIKCGVQGRQSEMESLYCEPGVIDLAEPDAWVHHDCFGAYRRAEADRQLSNLAVFLAQKGMLK
jgi:hypothetical protein